MAIGTRLLFGEWPDPGQVGHLVDELLADVSELCLGRVKMCPHRNLE